jgi:hypothetical protein
MAIISDDLVTDLRSLRGTELERTVHDAIKLGIDDALGKNIAPVRWATRPWRRDWRS